MRPTKALFLSALALLGSACGAGGATAPQMSFFDITYRIGVGPSQAEVVDMDCDGVPDVVALCPGDSSLAVGRYRHVYQHNQTDLEFVSVRHSLVWDAASDFCVADFDADGLPDVAVAGGAPVDGVALYLNDPSEPGTLVDVREMTTGLDVEYRVAGGDVNGDGKPDIVVVDEDLGQPDVFLNDPAAPGTFLLPAVHLPSFGGACSGLVLADMDHDGMLDLVTARPDGAVAFLLQGPRGTFKQKQWLPANFKSPFRVATGDVNGDGVEDVVVAGEGDAGPEIAVLLGVRGSPDAFVRLNGLPPGIPVTGTRLADLNRDGHLDLVATLVDAAGEASVVVYLGDPGEPAGMKKGTIKFFNERRMINADAKRLAPVVADVDGDGFFDIFLCDRATGDVHLLHRQGAPPVAPEFTRALQLDSPPGVTWADVQVADLNGDGRVDFVTGGSDGLTVHFQDAGAPLSFHSKSFPLGAAVDRVATADVDGDGRLDLGFTSHAGNLVGVLFHDAVDPEGFDPPVGSIFGLPAPQDIALADLDGDGRCDLAATVGGVVHALFQSPVLPRTFASLADYSTGASSPIALAARDMDCDGGLDLVCTNDDGTLSVLRHAPGFPPPGPTLFLPAKEYPLSGGIRVAAADVTGDGRADVVTEDPTGVTFTLQRETGPRGQFLPAFKFSFGESHPPHQPGHLGIVDMNHDGLLDIVLEGDVDGDGFQVLLNDPTAPDGFRIVTKEPAHVEVPNLRVATGDVNGDGWADVVVLTGPALGEASGHVVLWQIVPGPH